MIRRTLLAFGIVVGLVVVAIGAVIGVNAFDEKLTPEATALLAPAQLPVPSEKNGYVDMLGIGAPADANAYAAGVKMLELYRAQEQPGFKKTDEWKAAVKAAAPVIDKEVNVCSPARNLSCLEAVEAKPALAKLVTDHAAILARYRAIREKPEYVELLAVRRLESEKPAGQSQLHLLSLIAAASSVQAGDLEGAVKELEQENAFLRRMAAGAATMGQKQIAFAYLQAQMQLVSDVVRSRPDAAAYLPRLQALARPLSAEEAAMGKVVREEWAFYTSVLGSFDFLAMAGIGNEDWLRPWMPRLYRVNETRNLFVAQTASTAGVVQAPAPQYREAIESAKRATEALAPPMTFPGVLVNPAGKMVLDLMNPLDNLVYVGRMHDTQAMLALVSTQLALRAAGATSPEAIAAALAGPVGKTHPNPYTGKPMDYEPEKARLSFGPRGSPTTLVSAMRKKYGKVAVAI